MSEDQATDASNGLQLRQAGTGEGTSRLEVVGEIDAHTSGQFEEALSAMIGSGAVNVVIDMAGVTFIDSSGLRVLIQAHKNVAERGGKVRLESPSGTTLRLLEITGLSERFLGS